MAAANVQIPAVAGVRKVEYTDIALIKQLVTPRFMEYFGSPNVSRAIERSFLSLCVYNTVKTIIAVICLSTHPNIPAIPPWDWVNWMNKMYGNSLCIQLYAWDIRYNHTVLAALLTQAFTDVVYVHYVLLVVPPKYPLLHGTVEYFCRIYPIGYTNKQYVNRVQTIMVTCRQTFAPKYNIRRAMAEDNDNIVDLIDKYSPELKEKYGDYFLYELLKSRNVSKRDIIVAEHKHELIGMVCVTRNIAYEMLNKCYELTPYWGLRKYDSRDELSKSETLDSMPRDSDLEVELVPDESVIIDTIFTSEVNEVQHTSSESCEVLADVLFTNDDIQDSPSTMIISPPLSKYSSSEDFLIVDSIMSIHADEPLKQRYDSNSSNGSEYSIIALTDYEIDRHDVVHPARVLPQVESVRDKFTHEQFMIQCDTKAHHLVPSFYGRNSAFAIELLVTVRKNSQDIIAQLLRGAFESLRGLTYCILSVPSDCDCADVLQAFVRVPSRPYVMFPQELYILHRNALLGDMDVRIAVSSDMDEVKHLCLNTVNEGVIFMAFMSSLEKFDDPYSSFVLLNEGTIVGIIILTSADNFNNLHQNYAISDYICLREYPIGSVGLVAFALISPIFQNHKRYFLREVHRLSDRPILHYCMFPDDRSQVLPNLIAEMIPVHHLVPHEQITSDTEALTGDAATKPTDIRHSDDDNPFAVFMMSVRLTSFERTDVNRKIVVVGASNTGIAFLEELILGNDSTHLTFTNITLVSVHGLPFSKDLKHPVAMMTFYEGQFRYHRMWNCYLHCYVNLVEGLMTGIDRTRKCIYVNLGYMLPYDYLILTCGVQYQLPHIPNPYSTRPRNQCPENVFIVNTEVDVDIALSSLQAILENVNDRGTIIVYGGSLETYCCIATLQRLGISGENITFVEPNLPSETVSLFNDTDVEEAIATALLIDDITVYTGFDFTSWEWDEKIRCINFVIFESRFRQLRLPCLAMFMYTNKTVSPNNVKAMNTCRLVYDGRLVIDAYYKTNDSFIYAAGPMTKYARRYYAKHRAHMYFNSNEIGKNLAQHIRSLVDSTQKKTSDVKVKSANKTKKILTPVFKCPLIKSCLLPCGYEYLIITKPGMPVSEIASINESTFGKVYITGAMEIASQGYFRLHLTPNQFVTSITCLTKNKIDVQNMISIWGKHESLLNNFVMRFTFVKIMNLFSYFREPWTQLLFHEHFYRLEAMNAEIVAKSENRDQSLVSQINDILDPDTNSEITEDQRNLIIDTFSKSECKRQILAHLLKFIQHNSNDLPNYAHPLLAHEFAQVGENSPLHSVDNPHKKKM